MKTILITGSTDGIGKLAAIKLAQAGHEVYLHGRNAEKLEQTKREIIELSGNPKLDGFVADFSDLEAVKRMAEQVKKKLPKIDVLINNAGVFKSSVQANEAGFDLRFVVNYFAPYLLTKRLLPRLRQGSKARIINLSSAAQASISYEVMSGQTKCAQQAAYAQSKLALTMWSFYLAKTVQPITVIAVNPGSLLNTKMVKEGYGYHWSSADKGATILYDLAVLEQYAADSGKYFDNDNDGFGKAHEDAYLEKELDKLIVATDKIIEH